MRLIRNLTGTLLIAGMASIAYAASPTITFGPASAAQQQDQTTPPKQDQAKPKDTKPAKSPKTTKQPANTDRNQQADRDQQKDARQQPAHTQDRAQASGAHGRIKDSDYQAHFGRPHSFTVRQVVTTTRIVPHQTRFVYSGYSFVFLAPWPSEWALTDDCYIDYVDGEYVLIDPVHPGMTIALEIAE